MYATKISSYVVDREARRITVEGRMRSITRMGTMTVEDVEHDFLAIALDQPGGHDRFDVHFVTPFWNPGNPMATHSTLHDGWVRFGGEVIMDAAALRIYGLPPAALKAEIEKRYREKTYQAPDKPGVSYMVAPVMRTWMLPDWQVHTMPMQHLMFYAPNLTDQDIGSGPSSFPGYPFVFKEGIPEQSYMIQLAGEAERVRIVTEEKPLLDELCAYREVLCIPHIQH